MRMIFLIFILVNTQVFSQELNCNFQIMLPQTTGVSSTLQQSMQKSFYEFMNSTKWTNSQFENNERIECNLLINITSISGTRFTSTLQVISQRPVYNTSLQSQMLNYKEDDNLFEFEYVEGQSLEFNENRYSNNLTSVFAFYAYIIIGLDYDSYSKNGGTEYFQKAQKILNNAQNSNEKGWRAFEARKQDNRYFLIENLTNARYSPVRDASYKYHRLGLDVMSEQLEMGRKEIAESIRLIQAVYRQNTNLFLIKMFFVAKSDEIINVFSGALLPERMRIYTILKEIDPAHISQYEKLNKTE